MSSPDEAEMSRLAAGIASAYARGNKVAPHELGLVLQAAYEGLRLTQKARGPAVPPMPVKRPRGRPRKHPL
jgi:predicted transcriptional regulator